MVTIILPYDIDRGYLQRMRDSIKNQTYDKIELIEVHRDFPVAVNFNEGLRLAQGEFVKVVGEDDWLPPDSIKDLREGIGDHPWICANATNYQSGIVTERYKPDLSKLNLKDMIQNNVIHGGTTLYRTELLREIGGMDETLWTGEEYDLNLRLMYLGFAPGYVDRFVYNYQLSHFQKSRVYRRKDPAKREAALNEIRKRYEDFSG